MALDLQSEKRVFGLDVLRAFAVSSVLWCHSLSFVHPETPRPALIFIWGWVGVEIFFVLSGFLIGGMLLKIADRQLDWNSAKLFWVRRAFRTLPNYFIFLIVNLIIAWWLDQPVSDLTRYFFFCQNLAWRVPSFYMESWTLAMEEWFYFLLPLCLWGLYSCSKAHFRKTTLLFIVSFVVGIALYRSIIVSLREIAWFWTLSTVVLHADALMYGVLGAWFKMNFPVHWNRFQIGAAVVGVLCLAFATWCNFHHSIRWAHDWARTGAFSVTSLGLCLLLPIFDGWKSSRGGVARGIGYLSLWSYSLYLCQGPWMKVMEASFGMPPQSPSGINVVMMVVYIAGCILISAFWFHKFEKPVTDLRERFSHKPRQRMRPQAVEPASP